MFAVGVGAEQWDVGHDFGGCGAPVMTVIYSGRLHRRRCTEYEARPNPAQPRTAESFLYTLPTLIHLAILTMAAFVDGKGSADGAF